MEGIENIKELERIFTQENPNWEQEVYDATGVIFLPKAGILFSNCGYINLDNDVDYHFSGVDLTATIKINCIDDFISYILAMPSYYMYLKDVEIGPCMKAELFWALHEQIICAPQNLKLTDGTLVYGVYTISEYNDEIEIDGAVVEQNAACFGVKKTVDTIKDILMGYLEQINENALLANAPLYKLYSQNIVSVPRTYEELMKKLALDAEFGWLNKILRG